ncbi:MAG: hypothetical protein ABIR80_01885, partial [Opitutaceae bacterium]
MKLPRRFLFAGLALAAMCPAPLFAAGKGFAGQWRGSIKPSAGIELRLQANLQADADGKLNGHLLSLDQGGGPLP